MFVCVVEMRVRRSERVTEWGRKRGRERERERERGERERGFKIFTTQVFPPAMLK